MSDDRSPPSDATGHRSAERGPRSTAAERGPRSTAAERGPRRRVLRPALILLCLLLAGSAGSRYFDWRGVRDELVATLSSAGLDARDPETWIEVARERTSHHARLATARALVTDVLNLTPEERRSAAGKERIARLAIARDLAQRALREQPSSWQAPMLVGASIYLERALTGDHRLFTAHQDWEVPLRRAVREAGGKIEPRRLLIAAYLECWPALSAEKKVYARGLMKEVFRQSPSAFAWLAPAWLEAAPDREAAFELIPDRAEAWKRIGQVYVDRRDWDSFSRSYARRLNALERQLQEDLHEVEERLRLGDLEHSRSLCLQVVTSAPPSLRFVPLVVRALEFYPPGLLSIRSPERLHDWRRFALGLDALGLQPLTPRALSRLNDAIGELKTPGAARAALIAGDEYRLDQAEKLSGVKSAPVWAPFLIARARRQLDRNPEKAARSLSQIGPLSRSSISYWQVRQELARARGDHGAIATAAAELERLRANEWSVLRWRLGRSLDSLELLPAAPASGLVLELSPAAPTGAAVEVLWDGEVVAVQPVRRDQAIELSFAVEPRLHLLQVRTLAGGTVNPVRVWLR